MNPYDFARIDWNKAPERRKPAWHHRLTGQNGKQLYSGFMHIDIYAETPLFIADPRNVSFDPRKAAQSMQNQQEEYIIPGSSLKGMIRCVVETLGNGCLTLFDGDYERGRINYRREVPNEFQHCDTNTDLCIACRIFGMLKNRESGIFLGKVNIGDARSYPDKIIKYEPMYTAILAEPKPHHAAFYLDETGRHIAGRKYYFHRSQKLEPLKDTGPKSGKMGNRYIQPLDYDTQFHVRLDFTNLEADEFAVLMLAIVLEEDMRHKIGYGKPLGLGSIELRPISLTLIDYAARYTQAGTERGKTLLEGDEMWYTLNEHIAEFGRQNRLQTLAMDDLRRIWRWPAESNTQYYYPSKRDWFDNPDNHGKRIAQTL
ncbi:MAG TPA: RAMP superfamily CRISPR-associated protein [Ktedonosporobacter sp.]|jgi:hypothetical protein|nr:RAMP superfamily CRISPR-associated protein [Ktedonosporobacter sp.]